MIKKFIKFDPKNFEKIMKIQGCVRCKTERPASYTISVTKSIVNKGSRNEFTVYDLEMYTIPDYKGYIKSYRYSFFDDHISEEDEERNTFRQIQLELVIRTVCSLLFWDEDKTYMRDMINYINDEVKKTRQEGKI